MAKIKVIISAFNEADSISLVIKEIPDLVDEIIVVNNNSNDQTAEQAQHQIELSGPRQTEGPSRRKSDSLW